MTLLGFPRKLEKKSAVSIYWVNNYRNSLSITIIFANMRYKIDIYK